MDACPLLYEKGGISLRYLINRYTPMYPLKKFFSVFGG